MRPIRVALLGAESTGKSTLAAALGDALTQRGYKVKLVTEVLRDWCEREQRTPRPDEQAIIAMEQARLALEPVDVDFIIADTTPLMTAVYSQLLFGDGSLHPFAAEHQRRYDLTLLTGLDLPWVADGHQRDGAHVREPVDKLLRAALQMAGLRWQVIYGSGARRGENALKAIFSIATTHGSTMAEVENDSKNDAKDRWGSFCETCGDADCEHQLFSALVSGKHRPP